MYIGENVISSGNEGGYVKNMPTSAESALARYTWLKQFLKKEKRCPNVKYESIMMDQFGILPRTCAAYVKSMQALGLIKFEGFTAVWIGGNTE